MEFPSAQRLISVNSRSLTFGVLMICPGLTELKIGRKCQGKLTNVSLSYRLVWHAGVNWKGETLTLHHSFSPFPLVPHATALSYPVFVVLSTFALH